MGTKTVGRNAPCPCGSGKPYKQCCREKDRAAQSQADRAKAAQQRQAALEALAESEDLDQASNAVVDLVHAGKLDEAERGAHQLLVRFPEVHDGYDRLGMVYEARGQKKQAADCYRQVIQFVRDHPKQYDPEFADTFRQLVAELDPDAAGGG
jgi:tetratricopeptide (TPR) repeat protein